MRILLVLTLLGTAVWAQKQNEMSFEKSYSLLEQKIDDLKKHGEKLSEKSQHELEDLMAQLNHQHLELKRELDRKDQQLRQKMQDASDEGHSLSGRVNEALTELRGGFSRAWTKLNNDDKDTEKDKDN